MATCRALTKARGAGLERASRVRAVPVRKTFPRGNCPAGSLLDGGCFLLFKKTFKKSINTIKPNPKKKPWRASHLAGDNYSDNTNTSFSKMADTFAKVAATFAKVALTPVSVGEVSVA